MAGSCVKGNESSSLKKCAHIYECLKGCFLRKKNSASWHLSLYSLFSFAMLWRPLQIQYNACLNNTITQFACSLLIYIFLVYLSTLSTTEITASDGEKIGE
jgi:hypothetical protein